MNAHVDPKARLRGIISRAIQGCSYESSHKEDGDRVLVLEARRPDGARVGLRFLGLKSSETDSEPARGAPLRLRGVGDPSGSLLRLLLPSMLRTPPLAARVRIEAGSARLEIVCEDVEWWEEGGA
jgi:hypothetical protein